jgi:hypothetical protein
LVNLKRNREEVYKILQMSEEEVCLIMEDNSIIILGENLRIKREGKSERKLKGCFV